MFKRGWRPPWPEGKYSIAKSVSITLGKQNQEAGFRQVENGDGVTELATVGGRECRVLKSAATKSHYIYFAIEEAYRCAQITRPLHRMADVEAD